MMNPHDNAAGFIAILAGIGALIGLGKLLDSAEKLNFRLVAGRCLVNAGIGAAAGSISLVVPDASPVLMYGLAAGLASLGTSGFEYVMKRRLGGGSGE